MFLFSCTDTYLYVSLSDLSSLRSLESISLKGFLMLVNSVTHLIRAHQPPTHGIEYCKQARIMTVFSSSHYCGGHNSAAIILVSKGRIRVATTITNKPGDVEDEEGEGEEEESSEEEIDAEAFVEEEY